MKDMKAIARFEILGDQDLNMNVFMEIAPGFPIKGLPHVINCIESVLPHLKATFAKQTGRNDIEEILKTMRERTTTGYQEVVLDEDGQFANHSGMDH